MARSPLSGTFLACYQIGNDMPGAPLFTVHLIVSTPNEAVNGMGEVTQTTNPPLDLSTKLTGNFTYMTVMPQNTHILVTLTGYPNVHWSPSWGIGPVLLPNTTLQMVLTDDWKSGTANFTYTDENGSQTITNVPVKSIPCNMLGS
jgi:hypothetical protein